MNFQLNTHLNSEQKKKYQQFGCYVWLFNVLERLHEIMLNLPQLAVYQTVRNIVAIEQFFFYSITDNHKFPLQKHYLCENEEQSWKSSTYKCPWSVCVVMGFCNASRPINECKTLNQR